MIILYDTNAISCINADIGDEEFEKNIIRTPQLKYFEKEIYND